jgi:D-alanyl-D-alanine carboxypeptidase (penicillin-binding protein 5/6)
MNQKVKELGLKHTHFMNATGLDEKNHYSCSYDMAVIARELILKHPNILKYSSIYEDYLRENTDHKFWLVNTNKLIHQYEGTDGLKTGHTDDAGYCLAATTKRDNLRLIAIVLGEEDSKIRNKETMELLDYGFSNVKMKELKKRGVIIKSISFPKANIEKTNVILKESLNVIEEVGDVGNYQYKIELNHLKLPIEKNDVVGKIIVLENNKELSSGELVLEEEIKPLSLWDLFTQQLFHILYGVY